MKRYPFKETQKNHWFAVSLLTVCAVSITGLALKGRLRFLLLVSLSRRSTFRDIIIFLVVAPLDSNIWNVYIIPRGLAVFLRDMKERLPLLIHFILASISPVLMGRMMQHLTRLIDQLRKKIWTELYCFLHLLTESGGYRFMAK